MDTYGLNWLLGFAEMCVVYGGFLGLLVAAAEFAARHWD